jgi:hypothetical protein
VSQLESWCERHHHDLGDRKKRGEGAEALAVLIWGLDSDPTVFVSHFSFPHKSSKFGSGSERSNFTTLHYALGDSLSLSLLLL